MALTLHQGGAQQTYVEHPINTAKRYLLAAADLQDELWATSLRRVAGLLPGPDLLAPFPDGGE